MRIVLILGYVTFLRVKNKTIYDVRYDDMLGMLMKRHRKVSKPAISISINSRCCQISVHLCCFEPSIKLEEVLSLQAKYKATLVLNLTSHFFLS